MLFRSYNTVKVVAVVLVSISSNSSNSNSSGVSIELYINYCVVNSVGIAVLYFKFLIMLIIIYK